MIEQDRLCKKKYPFDWKWFFRQRVMKPWYLAHDALWWIRHRTTDKYHIVRTGLKPGYYDKDMLMLHACFNLLVRFIEVEGAFDHWDYKADEESAHVAREMKQLYHWWAELRPNRRDPLHDLRDDERPKLFEFSHSNDHGTMTCLDEEIRKKQDEKYPKYRPALEESWKLETKWHDEDQKNLHRLVDIRNYLWT